MAPRLIQVTDFVTGSPKTLRMPITVDDTAIATNTVVEVALLDKNSQTLLTPVRTASWSSSTERWVVTFEESDTKALLEDPTDLTSKLMHPTVLLETKIGAPYEEVRHHLMTVSKGLIP